MKVKKNLRKIQPNFQPYIKEIEAQAKQMVFLFKKNVYCEILNRMFFQ